MSNFINKADYWGLIKLPNLEALTEGNDINLGIEEEIAVSLVKSYLYNRYVTEHIFSQEGEKRDKLLIRHCVNVILWNIYQRFANARDLPIKAKNYDETMIWLGKVQDGEIGLDLPRRGDGEGGVITKFRGGSNQTQRDHNTDYV